MREHHSEEMSDQIITPLIGTSGAVIVGLGGMWIGTNQLGKRIDDLARRLDRVEDGVARRIERLEDEVRTFKELVSSKFAALDLELAKLMDTGH
jgi:hypothetical protein